MLPLRNQIILMGFKHVGKSILGQRLAYLCQVPFVDLDDRVVSLYAEKCRKFMTPRSILQEEGETFFRELESHVLALVVSSVPSVLSLGGGTPLCVENQNKMKHAIKVHIQAPRDVVFERILSGGCPGFFNPAKTEWENFCRLWDERDKIYRKISDFSILNDGSVDDAVNELLKRV